MFGLEGPIFFLDEKVGNLKMQIWMKKKILSNATKNPHFKFLHF